MAALALRIYSGLVMIAIALFMTLYNPVTFSALVLVVALVMVWEWNGLVRDGKGDLVFAIQLAAIGACGAALLAGSPLAALIILAIFAGIALAISRLSADRENGLWAVSGIVYAGFPAIGLIWLRGYESQGLWAVLYLFAVVWTTDCAAYLFGRMIGGPRLAPVISPKKTWAGLIGGVLSAGLVGAVFGYFSPFQTLWPGVLALVLAVIAQIGDLGESAVKRAFDKKDSSNLIPGHGGVLDRVDGVVSAAIAACVIALLLDLENPGLALLGWQAIL